VLFVPWLDLERDLFSASASPPTYPPSYRLDKQKSKNATIVKGDFGGCGISTAFDLSFRAARS
jgi:hypothetical protein